MAAETADIRNQTRRVKKLALDRAERILSHPEDYSSDLYNETYIIVLKNSVPQTREITGEDGGALQVSLVKYAEIIPTPQTGQEAPKE